MMHTKSQFKLKNLAAILLVFSACNKTNQSVLNGRGVVKDDEKLSNDVNSAGVKIEINGSGNAGGPLLKTQGSSGGEAHVMVERYLKEFDFSGSVYQPQVWVVTSANKVHRFKIGDKKPYPNREWTIPSSLGGGNRTYVTEVGLLVGKTHVDPLKAEVWLVHDDDDDLSDKAKLVETITDSANGTRVCVTSFKKGELPYIGYIYTQTATNKIKFVRMPIDLSKDLKIDVSRKEEFVSSKVGQVAYSCFVDQKNNRFWAAQNVLIGVNLDTDAFIEADVLPNYNVNLGIDSSVTTFNAKNNYAIAGDANGDLLNASIGGISVYTMAHERLTNKVFATTWGTNLIVVDAECFASAVNCNTKNAIYTLPEAGGPISSLNDGRVAILKRKWGSASSSVMLASLADGTSPGTKVLNVEKIAEVPGDAYMYTDFTGGTMYAPTVQQSFNLLEGSSNFKKGNKTEVILRWESATTLPDDQEWRGLKMLIRCYNESGERPDYEQIASVGNAGSDILVKSKNCLGGDYDHIDLRLEAQKGASIFTKSKKIIVKVLQ